MRKNIFSLLMIAFFAIIIIPASTQTVNAETEDTPEEHVCNYYYVSEEYVYHSSTQHKYTTTYRCYDCDNTKIEETFESHVKAPDSLCDKCKFPSSDCTLTSGTTKYFSGRPYLKISVPSSGYIYVKANSSTGVYASGDLKNYSKKTIDYYENDREPAYYFPVKKGTYYLRADLGVNQKIYYSFKSVKRGNTTRKKAYYAAKGKYKDIVYFSAATKAQHRWFKIKVGSKRKIRIYTYGYCGTIDIRNSKGKMVGAPSVIDTAYYAGRTTAKSTKTLKAGTYYIEFTNHAYKGRTGDFAGKFMWK